MTQALFWQFLQRQFAAWSGESDLGCVGACPPNLRSASGEEDVVITQEWARLLASPGQVLYEIGQGVCMCYDRTSGVLMTVRESLFHLGSLHSRVKPQPSTAFRVPSASLRKHQSPPLLLINCYGRHALSRGGTQKAPQCCKSSRLVENALKNPARGTH